MITNLQELQTIASRYGIPNEDLFFITLNLSGVRSSLCFDRVRFAVTLNEHALFALAQCHNIQRYYLAVPVRDDSPFSISEDYLAFDGQKLAAVSGATEDLCDTNYPRRNGTVLNFNPNRRTACRGCRFCYTDYQIPNDNNRLLSELQLRCFFTKWITEYHYADLSHLEQIAVVTGCFDDEEDVLAFLLLLRHVTSPFGFRGEIFYLGSQLSSARAIEALQDIQPFVYCISLECFENRERMVRDKKRMMGVGNVQRVIDLCTQCGHAATFSYVLGLDSFEAMKNGFSALAEHVTRFPIVNLLQVHKRQQNLRHEEAQELSYYLETRLLLEHVFFGTNLAPRPWENYRGLWYLRYRRVLLSVWIV